MSIPSLLQKRERERGSKTARGFVRERGASQKENYLRCPLGRELEKEI
jgi:hypothetical protein